MTPSKSDPELSFHHDVEKDGRFDVLEMALLLAHKRTIILRVTAICIIGAALVAFLLPTVYTATAVLMPVKQNQSTNAAIIGQLTAPIAGLAGSDLSLKNPNDLYIAMMRSRSALDALIQRYGLQKVYGKKSANETRDRLRNLTGISSGKDNLISIVVQDRDPMRAADLANAYTEELQKLIQTLAVSEASERRMFFEQQLKSAKDELANAEVNLRKTQESTGMIQLDSQSRAIIESVSASRAQIAAKEIQLRSLQSFATDENPEVIRLRKELAAMQAQSAQLERSSQAGDGNIQIATKKMPTAGLEYVRKLRDVKYAETLYEMLARQLESAKIDEAKDASVVQVLDRAIPPEKKSGPPRLLIIVMGLVVGTFLGVILAFLENLWQLICQDPRSRSKILQIKSSFSRS